ncbi:MAG: 3-oxoacyl-ACP reductase [Chitinophagales bacterium]|nr:3-oxoacyl-ACP reductase [Chitinophagales bacterium]MCZ2392612.1 3-oxoacyl-ACP reductase [Chitinophagales bacterium]
MSDYLQNPYLKQVLATLNIPVPSPEILVRNESPIQYDELQNKVVVIGTTDEQGEWYKALNQIIGPKSRVEYYSESMNILILDATNVNSIDELEKLYSFANANIKKVKRNGRILVLSTSSKKATDIAEVASKSLVGFVKSLAKEVGGKGIVVNGLRLPTISELNKNSSLEQIWPLIHFFVSDRGVFITGQTLVADSGIKGVEYVNNGNLKGKWALVTGAARGIGADTARAIAQEGATVIVLDVVQAKESLEEVASEIGGIALPVDITSENAEIEVRRILKEHNAQLDILVNNAGIIRDKTLAKMSPDQWRAVLNVNLKSVIRFTDALLKDGLADNSSIIGLSSIAGIAGNMGQTNYATSKAGLIVYTQQIAAQNAKRGITANAIAPGYIETPMTANLPFFVKEGGRRLSALKQGGLPIDIAQAITFFAGPGGRYVSGQVLRVCGGSFLGA